MTIIEFLLPHLVSLLAAACVAGVMLGLITIVHMLIEIAAGDA